MICVIVPAHRADVAFERCLEAITASAAGHTVIVVDDGSPGAIVSIRARDLGFRALRLDTSRGPAAARNLGAAAADSPLLLFIDADILVRPDTVSTVRAHFESNPDVVALFGSYDTSPEAPQPVSQFKNLTHHYIHQQAREEAFTFWAGCGAVRRDAFLALGGFNESYGRPSIEDIELGYRLRKGGGRIVLLKSLQVTHLKRWTLRQLVTTDVFDRGVPWTRLILANPEFTSGDLNLSGRARASLLLTWTALVALPLAPWWPWLALISAAAVSAVLLLGRRYFAWLIGVRGLWFAAQCVPLHLLYQIYSGVAAAVGVLGFLTSPQSHPSGGAAVTRPTSIRLVARTVGASFAALASGELIARLAGVLTTLYLARVLGVHGFGDVEVGLAVFAYLQLFVDGGLDTVAIRTVSRDPSQRSRFAANLLGIRLTLAVAIMVLATVATRAAFGTGSVRHIVLLYTMTVLPLAASLNWAFQAEQRMRAVAVRTVVTQLAYAALVLLLVHDAGDVLRVPVAYVAAVLAGTCTTAAWYVRRFGLPRVALESAFIKTVLPQAWPLALSGALRTVTYNFDLLILGFLFPSLGVGVYAAAYKLVMLPLLGYATLNTALFPTLVRLEGRDRLRAAAASGLLVVVSSMMIALACRHWATFLLTMTAGAPYASGASALGLLALSIPLTASGGIFRQLLLASGRQRQDLVVVVCGGAVNATLNLLLIPRSGLAGAAIATVIGEATVLGFAGALVIQAGMKRAS